MVRLNGVPHLSLKKFAKLLLHQEEVIRVFDFREKQGQRVPTS